MNGTYETCEDRVRFATRGMTEDQIKAVAKHHHETGDCVWHSVHLALKTLHCYCADCQPRR
jgi:hypothetical protein